tara:strand:- start:97 stop:588 length:492 start_codon:yes stop_codon:yes gene_type:complete
MSFFKKELNMVEKVAGLGPRLRQKVENVEKVSDHLSQHPMLQLSGPSPPESKRDHLERYEEVHPFEKSEASWFKNPFKKKTANELRDEIKAYAAENKLKATEGVDGMIRTALKAEMALLKLKKEYRDLCEKNLVEKDRPTKEMIDKMDKKTVKQNIKQMKKDY